MPTAFHTDLIYTQHTLDGHPEHAGRLTAIISRLQELKLMERLISIAGREATHAELRRAHTQQHLELLEKLTKLGRPVMIGADTYALPESYQIARLAAGGLLQVTDVILNGEANNGLAAIRPPGHHATEAGAMGFCLLNNVAIAARYAQDQHGLERIAIVDFDVHHGNGTQDIFYDDPSVFYISSHQSPLYPGTGHINETGRGDGRGTTLNIPVSSHTGDDSFHNLYQHIVIPALERFQPQLLFISAGFDAHWRDPLANLELSLTAYANISRQLKMAADSICAGRVIFVTEGGYDLDALSFGIANVAHSLLGDDTIHDPLGPSGHDVATDSLLQRLRSIHELP